MAAPGKDVDPITTLAFGPGFAPAYPGADEYTLVPFVVARARWGARYSVGTGGTGFRADIVGSRFIEAGPAVSFRLARNSDADDRVIAQLDEVPTAVEFGGFVALNFPFPLTANRKDALTIDTEWLRDVSNAHEGTTGRISIRYRGKVNEKLVLQTGPYLDFRSDDFARTYYGVSDADSALTGLDPFTAEGGKAGVGYRFNMRRTLSGDWCVIVSASVDHKMGDPADSPITTERGARTTYFTGFGIGRVFK